MNAVPKLNLVRDRKWLDAQHGFPCLITGEMGDDNETIDPAHLGTRRIHGDDETLWVKHRFHALGHQSGEIAMWRKFMPDWLLWECLRAYARQEYRKWKASNNS